MFSAASVSARFQLGLRDMRAVFFLVIHSMPLGSQLSMQGRYWHEGSPRLFDLVGRWISIVFSTRYLPSVL